MAKERKNADFTGRGRRTRRGQKSKASWKSTSGKARGPPDTGNSMWKGVEAQRAAILLVRQEHGLFVGDVGEESQGHTPGKCLSL